MSKLWFYCLNFFFFSLSNEEEDDKKMFDEEVMEEDEGVEDDDSVDEDFEDGEEEGRVISGSRRDLFEYDSEGEDLDVVLGRKF